MLYPYRFERSLFIMMAAASMFLGTFFLTSVATAEEPAVEEVTAEAVVVEEAAPLEVVLDETVSPEELGETAPRILPDSPWYALKSLGRVIRSAVTRDPAKKAELRIHYANQRLLEAEKLAGQGKSEVAEAALDKYQEELKKVADLKDKLRSRAREAAPRVDAFLEKAADYTLKHQRLLDKLEGDLPERAFEKVRAAREKSIEHISAVMERVTENQENIRQHFERAFDEQRGSAFKDLKNLEVLKRFEEKLPEEAREGVRQAMEAARERFKAAVETLPDAERAGKLKNYLERRAGEAVRELEVLEDIELGATPELRRDLKDAKDAAFERFKIRLEEAPEDAARELDHLREAIDPERLRFIERLRIRLPKDEQGTVVEAQEEALEGVQEAVGDNAARLEEFRARFRDLPELRKKFEEKREEFEMRPAPPAGEERSAEARERNRGRQEERREIQEERREDRLELREERREDRQELREERREAQPIVPIREEAPVRREGALERLRELREGVGERPVEVREVRTGSSVGGESSVVEQPASTGSAVLE